MDYLAALFKEGMDWNNYGKIWQIDHKTPIAFFDVSTKDGQKMAFHFSNLQPLFKEENMKKSDLLSDGTRARKIKRLALRW